MHLIWRLQSKQSFKIISIQRGLHQSSTHLLPSLQECYRTLGVTPTATPEEIKAAYIDRCKRYHPDRHQGNLEMQQKFVEVKEAYQKLLLAQKQPPGDITTGYSRPPGDFHAFYPKWKSKPKSSQSQGPGFKPFWDSMEKDRKYASDADYYKKEYYSEENTEGTRNLYKLFFAFITLQMLSTFVYFYFFKGATSSFTFHDVLRKDQFPQRFVVAQTSFRDKPEPTVRVDFINRDPRLKKKEETGAAASTKEESSSKS